MARIICTVFLMWRRAIAFTLLTVSTFSTSTDSTPAGLATRIQQLRDLQVWRGRCPYRGWWASATLKFVLIFDTQLAPVQADGWSF
jgi:hypothetical protein